ncbi:MAG: hypothetical protein ACOCZ9_00405 [Spirochaetota bacterium]
MEPRVEISGNQVTGLYVFLKNREDVLDLQCRSVLHELEKTVQGIMSIDELEAMLSEREGKQPE